MLTPCGLLIEVIAEVNALLNLTLEEEEEHYLE